MPYGPNDGWLMPFLTTIQKRPGMFLGREDVRTLDTYIFGYCQAREDLGFTEFGADETTILSDFRSWLAERLNNKGEVGWATLIETLDPGDRNIRTFFELFEEFLQLRGESLQNERSRAWPAVPWSVNRAGSKP